MCEMLIVSLETEAVFSTLPHPCWELQPLTICEPSNNLAQGRATELAAQECTINDTDFGTPAFFSEFSLP
jgi:hypothetical protein